MNASAALGRCRQWFKDQGWTPFPFQLQSWSAYIEGGCGLVNAPTGSGKTYSLLLPAIAEGLERAKSDKRSTLGAQIIWITPIRALAKEIEQSAQRAVTELGSDWEVGTRTGDSSQKIKQAQNEIAADFDHDPREYSCDAFQQGVCEVVSKPTVGDYRRMA